MIDHAGMVLAGIIPDRRDHLMYALQHLQEEHFVDEVKRNVFILLQRYYDAAADILPLKVFSDLLERQGVNAAKTLLYEEEFKSLEAEYVPDDQFRYAIDALKDLRAEKLTGEVITTGFNILLKGEEVDRVERKGHLDARSYLYAELGKIDRLNNVEAAPEGDTRLEGKSILQDYADRKSGKTTAGVKTGIRAIDDTTGGLAKGEVVLACAYTNQGKTQMCVQVAWSAAVEQGKNVFFATSETVREQVLRRILARHSRLPQFGRPDGIDSSDLKNGSLTPEDEKIFAAVVDDYTHNPIYGKMYIAQIPRGATLGFLDARLSRQGQLWDVDLAVVDYLGLIKADRKRENAQHELNDMLKDAKTMATSFNGGKGVPLLSPWQMSQNAYKNAMMTGEYTLANLADTSEAEKSADQIWSILKLPETPHELKLQFLKVRDGEIPPPATVVTDFRNSYFGDKQDTNSLLDSEDLESGYF